MKNKLSIYRSIQVWLLLLAVFVNSILFANPSQFLSVYNDISKIEKSVESSDYFDSNKSNQNLPYELPTDSDENCANDIDGSAKMDLWSKSIAYHSLLFLAFKNGSINHLYLEPLSLHRDIISPPPK
jgi:hypothetical protein